MQPPAYKTGVAITPTVLGQAERADRIGHGDAMKRLLLIIAGSAFIVLGVLGLILPFAPGLLFLLFAVVCFSAASHSVRVRLSRYPRLARLFTRLEAGDKMDLLSRLKLTFWACAEAVTRRA